MRGMEELLEAMNVAFFGNRIMLSGLTTIACGIAAHNSSFYCIGGIMVLTAGFGRETVWAYHLTKKHLLQHGKIEESFARQLVYAPYCDRQGLYLAARNYGHLDMFKKVTKAKINLPNF